MTIGYKHLTDRDAWTFGCPEGTWTGRLDQKAWGNATNLMVYFTDTATGEKYWFSVWHRNSYTARDGGLSFKTDAELGDLFELTTSTTKQGNPNLKSARKIAA
jgi:hypothetical protein